MNDVCLFLEGTYPYVAGGVSSWVNDLITEMDDVTFSIVYLAPRKDVSKKMRYELGANVLEFREIYLFEYTVEKKRRWRWGKKDLSAVEQMLESIKNGDTSTFDVFTGKLREGEVDIYDIMVSPQAWEIMLKIYNAEASDQSFIDYFWTWRFIYFPFFALLQTDIPPARLYHSVSTGYAGVLGAMSKLIYNRPFILTEHGLYTRERKIDISQADWIYSADAAEAKITERSDIFKEWWIRLFSFFSRLAYDRADNIFTLYDGNRAAQIAEGADPARCRVIPNGIRVKDFVKRDGIAAPDGVFRIGFMGRVVPIKDLKTFLSACSIVRREIKDIEIYVMGPTEEDEDYYRECRLLAETQSLEEIIHFTGRINIHEYYPKMDVIVLTSISEGQPIVILEANASGVPVVATDVGACSELLNGRTRDDRLIGPSGLITPVSEPAATAAAILELARSPRAYKSMSNAGRKRVEQYYEMNDLISSYKTLYAEYIEEVRWRA